MLFYLQETGTLGFLTLALFQFHLLLLPLYIPHLLLSLEFHLLLSTLSFHLPLLFFLFALKLDLSLALSFAMGSLNFLTFNFSIMGCNSLSFQSLLLKELTASGIGSFLDLHGLKLLPLQILDLILSDVNLHATIHDFSKTLSNVLLGIRVLLDGHDLFYFLLTFVNSLRHCLLMTFHRTYQTLISVLLPDHLREVTLPDATINLTPRLLISFFQI